MKTQSEEIFEKFCADCGISCHRIDERDEKAADYELSLSGTDVIFEVKEFERNKEEKESDRLLEERGYGKCLSNVPGDRVRSKLRKASPQIKRLTDGVKPGVLILFDRGYLYGHNDPYNILVAMSGLEQIHISVPNNPNKSPYATGMSHGPKKKMTETANTSISAIGTMYFKDNGVTQIDLYHNKYAAVSLVAERLAVYGIDQYFMYEGDGVPTSEWKKYEP